MCTCNVQVFVRFPLQFGVLDGLMSLLAQTLAQVSAVSFDGCGILHFGGYFIICVVRPCADSGFVRIDPLHFLAGYRKN